MTETQRSISQWADDTFGPCITNARIAARANSEMAELVEKLSLYDEHQGAGEEIADVIIVLYRLADRLGLDIGAEVDTKMAINRARKWKLDGTGNGAHSP